MQEGTYLLATSHSHPCGVANGVLQALIRANERQQRYRCILDSTKAIFFFGTPHLGSDLAKPLADLAIAGELLDPGLVALLFGKSKLVRPDLIRDLSSKEGMLDNLKSAFVEHAHKLQCILSFYERITYHGQIVSSTTSSSCPVTLCSTSSASPLDVILYYRAPDLLTED